MAVTGADIAGVSGVQRGLYMKRLFAMMLPFVRSGRMGRHHLQRYTATLRSLPLPAWLREDSGTVLARITNVLEHPNYQYDQSLAGDFGGLDGLLDFVSKAAGTVWGATKEVVPVVSEWVTGRDEPLPIRITAPTSPAYTPTPTAPAYTPTVPALVYSPTAPAPELPFGLSPLTLGAIALGAYLLLRK